MDEQYNNIKQNFELITIHPEEEPNVEEINSNITNIKNDLENYDNILKDTAENFKQLLNSTKLKLFDIKNKLNAEKERQEDINILCNKYSDFMTVINLEQKDFTGDAFFENNIVSAKITKYNKVKFAINNITGNGYEGNKYVYLDDSFIYKILDTSNKEYINDNNLATAYEYSRITVNNSIGDMPMLFNKDSIEAECSIELKFEDVINKIIVNSDRNDIVLKEVYTSLDGLTYKLDKEYNIAINARDERYNNEAYIYGSGLIAIEPSKFVKLIFKSNGYTDDNIAYIKTFYNDKENNEIVKKIEKVNSAKRHIVRINNINAYKNSYAKSMIISKELITNPVNCIGLYCNEYINNNYNIDKNVTYYLIINGKEHKIEPINSYRNGKKIIRTSSQIYQSEHVIYLNENIKSAKLKIIINTPNSDITPYLSNIKVLVGGE